MVGAALKKWVSNFWGDTSQDDDIENGVGQSGYDVYGGDYEDDDNNDPEAEGFRGMFSRKTAKVVAMPQPQQIQMKISKPTNFDQVDEVIFQLKNKNAVVINLEYVSKDVARRIVDTVGGAVTALDGHMEKVSNSIFVVAPFNYDIVNEVTKEKIEGKFSASRFAKYN